MGYGVGYYLVSVFVHLHSPSYLHFRDSAICFPSFIGLGRARVLFVGFLCLHTPKAFYRYSRPRTVVFPLLHHVSTPTARVVVFHASLILYTYLYILSSSHPPQSLPRTSYAPFHLSLLSTISFSVLPTPATPASLLVTLSFTGMMYHTPNTFLRCTIFY
ncbi:hypothetical protein BDV09DRAFT_2038 [Aspergillus tetrazonus]